MKKIITLFILLLILPLTACSVARFQSEKALPDQTVIDGLPVGGLTKSELLTALSDHHKEILDDITVTVMADGKSYNLSAKALGITIDPMPALNSAFSGIATRHSCKLSIDDAKLQSCVDNLAESIISYPKHAKALYVGKACFEFSDSSNGHELNKTALASEIKDAVQNMDIANKEKRITVQAKLNELHPDSLTLTQLKRANSLIAEYTSSFSKAPYNNENRVKNIVKAANLIDGAVIVPEGIFDTNKILGDRNEANGWYKAAAISNGKYSLEYGGGVCQVSSTLYNAALLCNLTIVERKHHSWPMGYVPIGQDATISTGGPNLVLKNSGDFPITVAAIVDTASLSLTIKLFGMQDTSYSRVEVFPGEISVTSVPKAEIVVDKSIPYGCIITDRKARAGKKVTTYRVFYDESGKEVKREVVCENNYRAIAARILKNF